MRTAGSDTRLDWRDPDMPVIRDYTMPNGAKVTEVDHDYERRYREYLMQASENPTFLGDPTYNMRKK